MHVVQQELLPQERYAEPRAVPQGGGGPVASGRGGTRHFQD